MFKAFIIGPVCLRDQRLCAACAVPLPRIRPRLSVAVSLRLSEKQELGSMHVTVVFGNAPPFKEEDHELVLWVDFRVDRVGPPGWSWQGLLQSSLPHFWKDDCSVSVRVSCGLKCAEGGGVKEPSVCYFSLVSLHQWTVSPITQLSFSFVVIFMPSSQELAVLEISPHACGEPAEGPSRLVCSKCLISPSSLLGEFSPIPHCRKFGIGIERQQPCLSLRVLERPLSTSMGTEEKRRRKHADQQREIKKRPGLRTLLGCLWFSYPGFSSIHAMCL